MAEESTQEITEETPEMEEAPVKEPEERTFTQDEVNKMVGEARMKERNKYKGYAEYKAKAEEVAELSEKANALEAERDALAAEKTRREIVESVASSQDLPIQAISMLSGSTEEELTAQAESLKKVLPAYPTVSDAGEGKEPSITADDIRAIKDTRERIRMRAAHPELFKE